MADVIYLDVPKGPDRRGSDRQPDKLSDEKTIRADAVSPASVYARFEELRGDRVSGLLERTIESEIIPRLMLAHSYGESRRAGKGIDMSEKRTQRFCEDVMRQDVDEVFAAVQALYNSGVSIRVIYGSLLGPAAEYAGQQWKEDKCSFVDVTLALNRLHQVVHRMRALMPPLHHSSNTKHILFTTIPGDQHSFGVALLADLFREDEWHAVDSSGESKDSLLNRLGESEFDVVGISVSSAAALGQIGSLISEIRQASRNRDVKVLVGGKIFALEGDHASNFGADAVVNDGEDAVRIANFVLKRKEILTEQ